MNGTKRPLVPPRPTVEVRGDKRSPRDPKMCPKGAQEAPRVPERSPRGPKSN